MQSKHFFALVTVSLLGSGMLIIDGIFSRIALEKYRTEGIEEQIADFAFWPLWLPLLLVQLVVVALGLRAGASGIQRNMIILMIFVFFAASLYSFIGHESLTKELVNLRQSL